MAIALDRTVFFAMLARAAHCGCSNAAFSGLMRTVADNARKPLRFVGPRGEPGPDAACLEQLVRAVQTGSDALARATAEWLVRPCGAEALIAAAREAGEALAEAGFTVGDDHAAERLVANTTAGPAGPAFRIISCRS